MPTYHTPSPYPPPPRRQRSTHYRSSSRSQSQPQSPSRTRSRSRPTSRRRRSSSSSSSSSSASSEPPSKAESALKTSLIFLGSVAAATFAAHKLWPKGFMYGDKDDWEKEEHIKHKLKEEKNRSLGAAGTGTDTGTGTSVGTATGATYAPSSVPSSPACSSVGNRSRETDGGWGRDRHYASSNTSGSSTSARNGASRGRIAAGPGTSTGPDPQEWDEEREMERERAVIYSEGRTRSRSRPAAAQDKTTTDPYKITPIDRDPIVERYTEQQRRTGTGRTRSRSQDHYYETAAIPAATVERQSTRRSAYYPPAPQRYYGGSRSGSGVTLTAGVSRRSTGGLERGEERRGQGQLRGYQNGEEKKAVPAVDADKGVATYSSRETVPASRSDRYSIEAAARTGDGRVRRGYPEHY